MIGLVRVLEASAVLFLLVLAPTANAQQTQWKFGRRAGIQFSPSGDVSPIWWMDSLRSAAGRFATSQGREVVLVTRRAVVVNEADTLAINYSIDGSIPAAIVVRQPGSASNMLIIQTTMVESSRYDRLARLGPGGLFIRRLQYDTAVSAYQMDDPVDSLCWIAWLDQVVSLQSCATVTVIPNSNGRDLWLLAPLLYPSGVAVWSITPDSTVKPPSVYRLDQIRGWNNTYPSAALDMLATGEIKASASGTQFAFAGGLRGRVFVCRFDPSIGIVSDVKEISDTINHYNGPPSRIVDQPSFVGPYGIEFSPDGRFLYTTRGSYFGVRLHTPTPYLQQMGTDFMQGELLQYDLTAGDADAIRASKQVIVPLSTANRFMGLQLGPDGRIYVAQRGHQFVSRINNPNARGVACGFEREAVRLLDSTACGFGFPFVMASTLGPQLRVVSQDVCVGDTALIPLAGAFITDSVEWDFGDTGRPSATVHGRRP
jgi:hypothetical protein